MNAINHEHIEWATVDRMRQMLAHPHPDFKDTGTLALFTGILCWTMQRIRTANDRTDVARRMGELSTKLEGLPFQALLKRPAELVIVTSEDGTGTQAEVMINSIADFVAGGEPFNSFRSLVALRNAVGHADARVVKPLNKDGLLIGYRFSCSESIRVNRSWVNTWHGSLCLDAAGMASIAGELADQFCAALQEGDPNFAEDASRVREASSQ
jgi:hypothetical protein